MNSATRAAFERVPGYLNSATVGLPPHAAVAALHMAAAAWGTAACDPVGIDAVVHRARTAYATIVGSRARDVAIAGSVSQVVGMVAASLPAGARVLAMEDDFTSVLFPFLADPRLTVELVPFERLVDSVRQGVDLVAASAARSNDGRVLDLGALAEAARESGTRTLVDVSQSAGWLPMDATQFDVVVAGGYKWLMTPRGVAFAAVRPEASWVRPVLASWYGADDPWSALYGAPLRLSADARRLDTSPAWQIMEAAAVSLETLAALDVREVNAYSVGLANDLRGALRLAPSNSAIVSVPGDAAAVAAAGVAASARDGRVRLAFYLYNDEGDVVSAAKGLGVAALV
ncbi:MAG: aminotransferase class V-fold PLP-dependent enzyme [Demequinaceae bacterium]|nr:aminotransferase class V-fold PLP-dependent enzyme [Demequinaceae bacterium]